MDDRFRYSVYGLSVGCNLPLPSLTPSSQKTLDVCIEIYNDHGSAPHIPNNRWQRFGSTALQRHLGLHIWRAEWKSSLFIREMYHHEVHPVEVLIDGAGSRVWIHNATRAPIEDIRALLIGPVLGSVLRRRRATCLHAAAVAINDKVLLLLGRKETGKSTTTGALLSLDSGIKVLSDDIAVLRSYKRDIWVEPGYPHLRLEPSALQTLGQPTEQLSTVLLNGKKRYLPLTMTSDRAIFQHTPRPLAAIIVLERRSSQLQEPNLQTLSRSELMLALIKYSYARFLMPKDDQTRDFKFLGRLANQVPGCLMRRPDSLEKLPQVAVLLMHEARALIPA